MFYLLVHIYLVRECFPVTSNQKTKMGKKIQDQKGEVPKYNLDESSKVYINA